MCRRARESAGLDRRSAKRAGLYRVGLLGFLVVFGSKVMPASAAPVSQEKAQTAVKGWLNANRQPLESALPSDIRETKAYPGAEGQTAYYVVFLKPAGFVIVPADDLVQPVVGFTTESTYTPSDDNPLGALVTRDMNARVTRARLLTQNEQAGQAVPQAAEDARSAWSRLVSLAERDLEMGLSGVSDPRVSPIVQSRWSQTTECGSNCYNYYTPSGYPCGCVATALSQVMRFHQHPTTGVGTPCLTIGVCGSNQTACLRGGNGAGGPYDWANMVLDPDCSITTVQQQAIGTLTYDAGVAVNMDYCSGGSGADTLQTATALKTRFGYSNAVKGSGNGSNIGAGLEVMINPNLDAGYPVILGITGSAGGHAIVADGYGYQSSTLYHHLNLGWAGSQDAWYHLPNIDSSPAFTTVYKCVYNIYVTGAGEIISGRVTDAFGSPISGAVVTAQGPGTFTDATDARGIYALPKVPSASSYTVSVAAPGYTFTSRTANTGTSIDGVAVSGNVCKLDFVASAYCLASGGCSEYISNVQVGTIDNVSGCSGYGDYTSLSTGIARDSEYPMTVTNGAPGSASDQCGIWVDWNRDGDWDDAEEAIVVNGTPGVGPYTASIMPPAAAVSGGAIMRVRIMGTGTLSPCGTTSYGEVEDYTINVTGCDFPPMSTDPTPADGAGNVPVTTNLSWDTAQEHATTGSLTTTFAGGNGHNGNMFDLSAKNTLTITGWDGNIDQGGGPATVEVYYVTNHTSYVGQENNPSAWALLGTLSLPSTNPAGTPTPVNIGGLTIAAGETVGVYWTVTNGSVDYSNGPLGVFENADLRFEDRGTGNVYPFGGTFSPRIWNGTIHYEVGTEPPCPTSYDVYLGQDNPPATLVCGDSTVQSCDPPGDLAAETLYYWQVVAKNVRGTTLGPVWSFTTAASSPCQPPPVPSDPTPADNAEDVTLTPVLTWGGVGPVTCGVVNGGFETGDFNGWTATNGPGTPYQAWGVVTAGSGTWFANGVPAEGTYYAQNGFDGEAGLSYDLYQEVLIPAGAATAVLNWGERIQWDLTFGATLPRPYEVTLEPAGGGVPLAVLYSASLPPNTTGDTGYVAHSVDLLAAAPGIVGSTVRIAFHELVVESFVGPAQFDLDAISLVCNGAVLSPSELAAKSSPGRPVPASPPDLRAAYEQWKAQAAAAKAQLAEGAGPWPDQLSRGDGIPQPLRGIPETLTGTLLYDNGAPNLVDAWESTNWSRAEDFTLTSAAVIQSVRFWTIEAGAWDGACQVAIHADAAGQPGAVLASASVAAAHVATGRVSGMGDPEYQWEFDLPSPVSLAPGKYWLELHLSADCVTREDIYWETGSPAADTVHYADTGCVGVWSVRSGNLAFQLYGNGGTGCPTVYDVYFGADNPPTTKVCSDVSAATCTPGTLNACTTYYWQVVAKNPAGQTPGPVWRFKTGGCGCPPPPVPSAPNPLDGATHVPLNALLTWNVSSPTGDLYAVDADLDTLYTLDLVTGAAAPVGSTLPMLAPAGLAWTGSAMYAIDLADGGLYALDLATGAPTLTGNTGITGWQGLAADPTNGGQLYGVTQDDVLYRISVTGTATPIASGVVFPGGDLITGLCFDGQGRMWGVNFYGGQVGRIDQSTGALTLVTTTLAGFQAIDFDANGTLWGDNTETDSLYTIDLSTGMATLIGSHATQFVKGMAFRGLPGRPGAAPEGKAVAAGQGMTVRDVVNEPDATKAAPVEILQALIAAPLQVHDGDESVLAKNAAAAAAPAVEGEGRQGGPDAGGYTFIDSNEPGGPSFTWVEISGTGTNLNLGDDQSVFPINLPFAFDLYGVDYTQIAVSSNGTVYFQPDYLGLASVCIPGANTYGVERFIAVYWDDLNPGAGGDVYYEVVGTAPNRKLVVQWERVLHFGSSTDTITVQAQLHENGDILLLYEDPSDEAGAGCVVGIQGDVGTGLGYLCKEAALQPGLAILFSRGSDPCMTSYDVYLSTDNPPTALECSDISETECDPATLLPGPTYYWQVCAKNPDHEVCGPVWSFTTKPVPADFDRDCDVDHDDFDQFQDCAAGPTVPYAAGCEPKDLDGDGDADLTDFGIFQGCYSGAGNPGDPDCAE